MAIARMLALPALLLLAAVRCSAPPGGGAVAGAASGDPWDVAPVDFSIDLTVLAGEAAEPRAQVQLRDGRFVLLADGSLRYGDDPGAGPATLPDQTRTLTRRQVAETWSLVRQLGFVDHQAALPAMGIEGPRPEPGQVVYLLALTGDQRRWTFVSALDETQASQDTAMGRLVRHLAALAWATDRPESARPVTVRRADFGPDPYERYRP